MSLPSLLRRWLVISCLACFEAVPATVAGFPTENPMVVDVGAADGSTQEFQETTAGYSIHGSVSYDRSVQRMAIKGAFVTNQPLDPEARFSYQVYAASGRLLNRDGGRFDFHPRPDGKREAEFEFRSPSINRNPTLQDVVFSFNCVVEGKYWYRDNFPQIAFPALRIVNLPGRSAVRLLFAWVPAIVPAETVCYLPTRWMLLQRANPPGRYRGSVEVTNRNDGHRIDQPRRDTAIADLPDKPSWQVQEFVIPESGTYRLRPGWVWDGVRWYSGDTKNPFVTVRAVGPLTYFLVAAAFLPLLRLGWKWTGRAGNRAGRWLGRLLVVVAALAWTAAISGNAYAYVILLLLGGAALRRLSLAPGTLAYCASVIYVIFLEFYWGTLSRLFPYAPLSIAVSAGIMAVVLFPLAWVRPPWLARSAAAVICSLGFLLTTGLVVYYQFFQDFPSFRDLAYASQIGELGGSVRELIGQRHLVPVAFALLLLGILFRPAPVHRRAPTELRA